MANTSRGKNTRDNLNRDSFTGNEPAEKGVPTPNEADHTRKTLLAEPRYDESNMGSPGVVTSHQTAAAVPPVDPARTLNAAMEDPENIGESSSGYEAKLADAVRQESAQSTRQLRGGGPDIEEAAPVANKGGNTVTPPANNNPA